MNKKVLNIVFVFVLISSMCLFYFINNKNYIKLGTIKQHIVSHPELLPKKEIAKYTSFGFANLRADIYWLETIQYIGGNAISSSYKKYLYTMLDLITELNPYFEKPYIIGQLLLPNYNERYETLTQKEQSDLNSQGEKIGQKGLNNLCDITKMEKIKQTDDLSKLWNDESLKNPCKTQDLPSGQAFLEYYYLKDTKKASQYYKIASAQSDSVEGNKIMAAIMSGKSGNREKSIFMFLTIASGEKQSDNCKAFSSDLQKLTYAVFETKEPLTSQAVKQIEDLRNQYFKFNENDEKDVLKEDCSTYINKAVRELNLYYLEQANKKYFEKYGKNAQDGKELLDSKTIDFLPTDFQQYKDNGIIYKYNDDLKAFDYDMGKY